MKKIPMILLVIAPYTLVAFMFYSVSYNTNIRAALIVYIAILLLNMGYAFLLPWMEFGGKEILFWNMLLKLCHIPVYLGVMFFVLLTHALSLPLVPILVVFDYSLLLSSTMYGISGMLRCYKEKRLNSVTLVANMIAQFVFCLDVISAIYCFIKTRKSEAL